MMTPRSRARNTNRYGSSSPLPQRGGGSGVRGGSAGPHPPTINIVDSYGHPQQLSHNTYNDNVNEYLHSANRSFSGNSPTHYAVHAAEGRGANASLPTSPITTRNTRPIVNSREDGTSTSATHLPGGGGGATFYWAAKV